MYKWRKWTTQESQAEYLTWHQRVQANEEDQRWAGWKKITEDACQMRASVNVLPDRAKNRVKWKLMLAALWVPKKLEMSNNEILKIKVLNGILGTIVSANLFPHHMCTVS